MILVTGASRGLGNSICKRLIKNEKKVIGIARNTKELDFLSYDCDVSSFDDLKLLSKQLKQDGIVLDCIINAAGIAAMNLAITTPQTTTEKLINTNLLGTIYSTQAFFPLMIRNKSMNKSIINFSTIAVNLGLKGESIYIASKSGVEGFSRAFSREAADFGVRVNCIAPGPIQTDLISGVSEKQINKIIQQQIFQKMFNHEDVCNLVEILIDKRSSSLTGEVLNIGGA